MPLIHIIILFLIGIFLLTIIYIEPILFKHKVKNDNEHGSARFATKKEIKKNFKKETVSNIREAGFPIWFSKDLKYVYFDRETPHYVYLGSTGSGKSVTAVIPTCSFIASSKIKRSVFITDPKGEIFSLTSKMFKDNGYNVITIDFRHPELSNKINILEPIIKEYELFIEYDNKLKLLNNQIDTLIKQNEELQEKIYDKKIKEINKIKIRNKIYDNYKLINNYKSNKDIILFTNKSLSHLAETNRLISSLSQMIMQEKVQQKDPFWNNSAKNLLEGLIGFFLEEYRLSNIRRNQITMTSIRKFQNSSMETENLKKFKEYVNKKEYGSKSKDSLTSILSASDNTFKSITAVFGEKMALFDDVNVANVTSTSDFDFDVLGKEPTAFYVIVPDEDKTYFTLVTIIVGILYKELVKLANSREEKKLKIQIDWILDEFANCPPLADIEAMVSVARSRGMRFHFFIQSFSQLYNVYGKDVAQIILDNCGLIYLKTNTQETAEAISKRLGKKTIETNSVSQSVSLNNYNGNRSTSLIARDLLTPDEVKQLHFKTIIFPIIGYPIFRDTVIYNKFSCYLKGKISRDVNPLKDLSDTYFTVEQIKYEMIPRNNKIRNEVINKEQQDLLREQEIFERNRFIHVKNILNNFFKKDEYVMNFNKENGRQYLKVIFNKDVSAGLIIKAKSKISSDQFVCIYNNKERILEIHIKSFF